MQIERERSSNGPSREMTIRVTITALFPGAIPRWMASAFSLKTVSNRYGIILMSRSRRRASHLQRDATILLSIVARSSRNNEGKSSRELGKTKLRNIGNGCAALPFLARTRLRKADPVRNGGSQIEGSSRTHRCYSQERGKVGTPLPFFLL